MKRMLYGALIVAALLVPTQPQELGKLKAVEAVRVTQDREEIIIETDTEDSGRGRTLREAVQNLKETTAGTAYLDTAEYLLLSEGADIRTAEFDTYLKGSVRICRCEGKLDLKEAAKYLDSHQPEIRLKHYRKGMQLQMLVTENGRMNLQKKDEK